MLAEDRQYGLARQQFKAAAAADEYHLPVWQAWAVMELRAKDYERARQLFQRGVWAAPKDPNLVWLWQVRPAPPGPPACASEGSCACVEAVHADEFSCLVDATCTAHEPLHVCS